jgi:hypothetical protein
MERGQSALQNDDGMTEKEYAAQPRGAQAVTSPEQPKKKR